MSAQLLLRNMPQELNKRRKKWKGVQKFVFDSMLQGNKLGETHQDSRFQEEIESMMLEIARDLLKSLIPQYLESHNKNDTCMFGSARLFIQRQKASVLLYIDVLCTAVALVDHFFV